MARPFVLEIAESETFLEKSLKQAKTGFRKERLQMLWWIKTKQIRYWQEIGERLGRSPATISRWLLLSRQGGLAALLEELSRTQPHRTLLAAPQSHLERRELPLPPALQHRVDEELARLTPEQVQAVTGHDFILDALRQAECQKTA